MPIKLTIGPVRLSDCDRLANCDETDCDETDCDEAQSRLAEILSDAQLDLKAGRTCGSGFGRLVAGRGRRVVEKRKKGRGIHLNSPSLVDGANVLRTLFDLRA